MMLDAGDAYFAAPAISQLLMGESTIDVYNRMGYDAAAFGNHEFDKGQEELQTGRSIGFPWLGANVVLEGTDWDLPDMGKAVRDSQLGQGAKRGEAGRAGSRRPETRRSP